jgi:hypothetical protein
LQVAAFNFVPEAVQVWASALQKALMRSPNSIVFVIIDFSSMDNVHVETARVHCTARHHDFRLRAAFCQMAALLIHEFGKIVTF